MDEMQMSAVLMPSLMGRIPSLFMRAMMTSAGPWPRANLKALYSAPMNSPPNVSASRMCHLGTSVNDPCLYLNNGGLWAMVPGSSEVFPWTRRKSALKSRVTGLRWLPENFSLTGMPSCFSGGTGLPSRSVTGSMCTVRLASMCQPASTGSARTPAVVATMRQVPWSAHFVCLRELSP